MENNKERKKSNDSSENNDYFSFFVIGEANVGKTSILNRYCNNDYNEIKKNKKNIELYKKNIECNQSEYRLKFWDTQFDTENLKANRQIYARSDGVIFVCSFDNKSSLDNLTLWYKLLCDNIDLSTKQLILFVNKNDLEENRVVGEDDIKQKCEELKLDYFEMSAKSGKGIKSSFEKYIKKVILNTYEEKTFKKLTEENIEGSSCIIF